MAENETFRIQKVAKDLGVGFDHVREFLSKKGIDVNPNSKIDGAAYDLLLGEFQSDKSAREASKQVAVVKPKKEAAAALDTPPAKKESEDVKELLIKEVAIPKEKKAAEVEVIKAKAEKLSGPTVKGKIDLDAQNSKTKPDKKSKKAEEEVEETKTTKKTAAAKKKTKEEEAADVEAEKASKKAVSKKTKTEEEAEVAEAKKTTKKSSKKEVEETPAPEATEPIAEEVKKPEVDPDANVHKTQYTKIEGPTILGKIVLPVADDKRKPVASSNSYDNDKNSKKKRKRIRKGPDGTPGEAGADTTKSSNYKGGDKREQKKPVQKAELTPEEIQNQIKETLARLSGAGKSKASKHRRLKRDEVGQQIQEQADQAEAAKSVIKVTEFVSASELASMMNIPVNEIISTCMSLGMFVSINQRLNAETISIVAEEFGFTIDFVSADVQVAITEEEDKPEDLKSRAPIVTVMGHVDHGKTSLLDYIRKANVIAGEAGGITQHIGAYSVELENGKRIAFLDTPGHEAFTAMRARGAQVTDIVIIVVAADDNVMPQTKEAINHAQAAGVPIVIAINKIDKPGANPDKIREELSAMNILVEEWGGKFQCQEISAKKGTNIDALLDKVLLEAEMLDLKANPKKNAFGTVIESELDKGRGYVTTILVQAGTLKVGDTVLAGCFSGKVKALFNERNQHVDNAGPSTPALMLGLSGAPQAGDKFKVMDDEREARDIATRRLQLQREQGYRTQKHITLDEIGRRLAIGDFKELKIIVKGDVDGSVEALTDSLMKLSSEKIAVNVIMKGVGQVTESDVLLASASDAIIVAFNVRPSANARRLAEQEQIDVRTYSIIYNAINEVKDAMEGMLAPEFEEKIVCNIQIREVFNITKVGTIAGCMVTDGKVNRNTKVRVIRDGIVIHTGELGSLKRFKDDAKEVAAGYECGLNIANFNDIAVGDIIEGYEMVEMKKQKL